MDSLTHLALGAALGEALLGKKIGRKAMLWGAIANTIPDLDVFAAPLFTDAQQLLVHRGITHSFLFAGLMSPLLGWLFSKWFNKSDVSWKGWAILFLTGMLSHIGIDSLTGYGTGWFEPFSTYRVSFNTIFVADLHYTLPLLICVIVAFIAKNGSPKRIKWNRAGLIISSAYLIFTIFNHEHVLKVMETSFKQQNLITEQFIVTPTPLNNYLWMAYTQDKQGSWIGYYSEFDKDQNIQFHHVLRNDSLLTPFEHDPSFQLIKRFTKGHYCVTKIDSTLYLNDIRFGQEGGWDNPNAAFVFKFKLNEQTKTAEMSRARFNGTLGDALSSLINRIKGK